MPRFAKFASVHEAAHAVAIVANRKLLRARIGYVSIVPGDRLVRTCKPVQYRTDRPSQIRAVIEVALAGVAANLVFSRMSRTTALFGTGTADWKVASDAARFLHGSEMDDLLENAIKFVKRERSAVSALAEKLLLTGQVAGEEAEQIIIKHLSA